MDINEILEKPGREWTKEETLFIRTQIKASGRQFLKSQRKELLTKKAGEPGERAYLLKKIKDKDGKRANGRD